MKKIDYLALLALLLLTSIPAFSQQVPSDTSLRKGKLDNGLTYYVKHNEMPKGAANFYIVQKVGSILEQDNQRGLAHFLEHEAFNGTKHFPGTSIVTEMEKKGVQFGSHINAYTSFDETVYNINDVPMRHEGTLDTALLILHDWSGEITNYQQDIEEERGIIREEWRTRSSAAMRMDEKVILPTLLAGTPYADRMPIGTMDVVNNFKRQELVDYYKKWYRPDLQGIMVVGDIDPDKVVTKLKELFRDIPASVNSAKREYIQVPDNDAPLVAIATDPEYPFSTAKVSWKENEVPVSQRNTKQFFKIQVINTLISNMLNQRLYLKAEKKGSPLLNPLSSMGNYSITQRPAWNVEATAANNDVLGALKILLTECERMRRFGFNANEFEGTMKHFYISINETSYIDRDFIPNIEYNLNYTANFLYNDPVPDAEWEYRTTKEIYEGMTIDTLNFYAKQYIHDHNMAFEIDMPDKAGVIVPAKDQVLALWNEVRNTKLKPYVKKKERNDLAKLKAPQPGTIIKTEKNTSPFGYTKWTFANGANVWFKRTDIKESTVFIDGRKQGGYSLVGLKDLPSAAAYNSIIPFSNRFNGFDGLVTYSQDLDKTEEKIFLKASVADLKLLFQQAYVNLTHFKKKPSEFNNWQTQELQFLKNRVVSSKTIFRDTLTAILRNHSPWALTLSDPAKLKAVNYNTIARLHKEFFGNAAGFTFIIAGNVSEDTVKSLAATWLGGLPSNGKTDQVVDHGDYPPPGIIKKHLVEKMVTPKTTVGIIYSGEIPLTAKNEALMGMTTEILKTRYLATIRQKEGASYGVGVKGEVYKYPKERYYVQISFDTDPDTVKKEKMIAIVYDEIQKLIKDGPDKDILEKSRKDFTTTYEQYVQLKNSSYWSGVAAFYYENGFDYTVDYGNALRTVTPDEIQAFAKNVFSQGNLIEIKMDPAK